jgi:ankyrin repeat protein
MNIPITDSLAHAVMRAIHKGDVAGLRQLLAEHPALATARIIDRKGSDRTLLHVATDWPGHFPGVAETIAVLIAAGADPSAGSFSKPPETPLHWAASSNDVAALDALLDGGADIEAPGAVFTGGTAMSDAVIFANWDAARRLLARGARTTLSQASGLGLLDRVKQHCARQPPPTVEEITGSFWHACRGGQRGAAEYLLSHGANAHWVGWDHKTPLQVAAEAGHTDVAEWLVSLKP